jgi:hypothetical protein
VYELTKGSPHMPVAEVWVLTVSCCLLTKQCGRNAVLWAKFGFAGGMDEVLISDKPGAERAALELAVCLTLDVELTVGLNDSRVGWRYSYV